MTTDAQGFYPAKHAAPILVEGKRPHWNDFQPAVYNTATKQWNAWVLENEDINTETGTAWRKLVSDDCVTWTPAEITIPKNTAGFGDAWTGQCVIDENNILGYGAGVWCFFVTMACPDSKGNQNQSVVLWTAPDGQTAPVCQGMVLANPWGGNAHFRDPSVRFVNGRAEMTITTGTGISIYQWDGNEKVWFKVQDIDAPYHTVECAQRFTMWSEDFGKTFEVLFFSGNIFDAQSNQNTTVSMFSLLTPCASGYCMTTMSTDVRRMCVNNGTDFYSFRVFSGLPNICCPNDTKVYGMAWIGNWDYDAGVPIEEWCGQLSLCCEVTLKAGPSGFPVMALNPLVPKWKKSFTTSNVTWTGDYSNIPVRQVPDVCEINMEITQTANSDFPPTLTATIYNGGYVGAKLIIDSAKGTITCTRDDYGLRPYGDLSSWNYYPQFVIPVGLTDFKIRIIKDRSSITWVINDLWTMTQMVLFPEGSPTFYVDVPKGYSATGSCTVSIDKFPGKTISSPTNLDITGRCMPIETPVITTYEGASGTGALNHPIKQLAWVTDPTGKNVTGLVGVIDDFSTGAISMELKANQLNEDYTDTKKIMVTSVPTDSTNEQVRQVFYDPSKKRFMASIGSDDTQPAIAVEQELAEFRKTAVTSFADQNGDTTGNTLISQITYNAKDAQFRAILATPKPDSSDGNGGGSSSGSGSSGSGSGSSGSSGNSGGNSGSGSGSGSSSANS